MRVEGVNNVKYLGIKVSNLHMYQRIKFDLGPNLQDLQLSHWVKTIK